MWREREEVCECGGEGGGERRAHNAGVHGWWMSLERKGRRLGGCDGDPDATSCYRAGNH